METIKASEFQARCLALMDEVARSGKSLVVTKNGKPVVEMRPYRPKPRTPFGVWKHRVVIKGDIVSPVGGKWEALE